MDWISCIYICRLRSHMFKNLQIGRRENELELGWGYEASNPTSSNTIHSARLAPKGSTIFPTGAPNWVPDIQIAEPKQDISDSNHSLHLLLKRWKMPHVFLMSEVFKSRTAMIELQNAFQWLSCFSLNDLKQREAERVLGWGNVASPTIDSSM